MHTRIKGGQVERQKWKDDDKGDNVEDNEEKKADAEDEWKDDNKDNKGGMRPRTRTKTTRASNEPMMGW
jgi:hypothetical protein